MDEEMIKRAIESAMCRHYYLRPDDSMSFDHQKKAERQCKLMRVTIKALKKQLPKKPDYEADGYADGVLAYDYAQCPVCGHDFEYGINDWGCDYCSDCGQRLDWSDVG